MKDRRTPGHFAVAQRMAATGLTGTQALPAFTSTFEYTQDLDRVAKKARRLLQGIAALGLLAVLALVGDNPINSVSSKKSFNAWLLPRCRPGGVFVQEVGATVELLGVHLAAPFQMHNSRCMLRRDNVGIAFPIVYELPSRKRSTHRRPDEKQWSLFVEQGLSLITHSFLREIPWHTILVRNCQIQRQARINAIAGHPSSHRRNARR
jgi:hypothetical protein